MSRQFKLAIAIIAIVGTWSFPSTSEAGPLLDWIRGRRTRQVVYRQPNTLRQATPGTFTQAPTYLQPGQCQRTCMQTYQRVVVNYVPYTDYRTHWARIPVTQYRPVTTQDPRSGCVVTCMKPCINYTWQLQRTPYTTYRPVYRTQNYRVPITTITNNCANGACGIPGTANLAGQPVAGGCNTCGVAAGTIPPAGQVYPNPIPGGVSQPGNVPANQVPTLDNNVRSSRRVSYRRPLPENFGSYIGSQGSHQNGYSNQLHGSAYGVPEYRPSPSGFVAPAPANESNGKPAAQNGGNAADRVPILQDDVQPTSTPKSVLQQNRTTQPIQDPNPEKRWNLQASTSAPMVSLASNPAVVKPWGYRPVETKNAFGKVVEESGADNELKFQGVNSQWTSM